jgi:hypothetical protein
VTPYTVNRHLDRGALEQAIAADVVDSCLVASLTSPSEIRIASPLVRRAKPISAHVAIEFATAVQGPLLLGRTRFTGGGVFEAGE